MWFRAFNLVYIDLRREAEQQLAVYIDVELAAEVISRNIGQEDSHEAESQSS